MKECEVVYIVDDDPGLVNALSRLTRTAGFLVEAYSSAREFLEHHRKDTPGGAVWMSPSATIAGSI